MTDLPDDILRACAELPREREPDPALEERILKAVFPRRRRWIWIAPAAAAALVLLLAHPWSPPRAAGQTYVLLLSEGPNYVQPAGRLLERRREYGRWADSLARLGKLDLEGAVEGSAVIDGLFVIRAANDADAARIAATCPHNKYGGHIEVRRLSE